MSNVHDGVNDDDEEKNDDDIEEGRVDDGVGAGSNVRIRTEDGGRFTSTRPVLYVYTLLYTRVYM